MKYVLVSLSVVIQGKKFSKENKPELDDTKFSKKLLEAAYKNGFIKPKGTPAKNPKEVQMQYLNGINPVIESEFPEDMPGAAALINSKITTFEQLKAIDDFADIKGIGAATSKQLTEWLDNN